jgi:ribose 5-phosphate isomerase RpiB
MGKSIKKTVTNKRIIEHLEKHGIEITEKNAAEVLELLYFLAKLIVKQNFKNENRRSIYTCQYRRTSG